MLNLSGTRKEAMVAGRLGVRRRVSVKLGLGGLGGWGWEGEGGEVQEYLFLALGWAEGFCA